MLHKASMNYIIPSFDKPHNKQIHINEDLMINSHTLKLPTNFEYMCVYEYFSKFYIKVYKA